MYKILPDLPEWFLLQWFVLIKLDVLEYIADVFLDSGSDMFGENTQHELLL
jgi:hypothetical protein